METFLLKALQLMLSLALLVTIHEFGHFIFARMFGIKVEKFYMFFNPWFSLFKWKPKQKPNQDPDKASWRDTEYGIGWLPLGGYVKIAGMIDESMDKEQMAQPMKPWEFRAKPAWQRLGVMVAGVLFNFILAILIYAGIVYHWGESFIPFSEARAGMEFCESAHRIGFQDGDIPLYADDTELEYLSGDAQMAMLQAKNVRVLRNGKDTVTISIPDKYIFTIDEEMREKSTMFMLYQVPVVVKSAERGMGAAESGMLAGDSIVSVNGVSTPSFKKFTAELQANKGQKIPVGYFREGKLIESDVQISENGKIGIMLMNPTEIYDVVYKKYSILASLPRGIEMGVDKLTSYVSSMSQVFTVEGAQSLGGFGALGSIFPEKWDWLQFWNITAFLSVILAFMNILPIPALDGGHVLFLLVEIVTRRKPSEKFMEYAQVAGMIFLFALLIFANGNDIYRFFFK